MATWVNWKTRKPLRRKGSAQAAASTTSRPAVSAALRPRPTGLDPPNRRAAEEAARLDEEDDDDHGQRHRQLELCADERDVGSDEILRHPHEKASHHRAERAREAAHRRGREGVELDADHHVRVEEDDGGYHDAGD